MAGEVELVVGEACRSVGPFQCASGKQDQLGD